MRLMFGFCWLCLIQSLRMLSASSSTSSAISKSTSLVNEITTQATSSSILSSATSSPLLPQSASASLVSTKTTQSTSTDALSSSTFLPAPEKRDASFSEITTQATSILSSSPSAPLLRQIPMPDKLSVVGHTVDGVRITWEQSGSFSHFDIRVDYQNRNNVTNAIMYHPQDSQSNGTTQVSCNISELLAPGGQYSVNVSAVYNGSRSDFQNITFQTIPQQPGDIRLFNQSTMAFCSKWEQSGNVEKFLWNITNSIMPRVKFDPSSNVADCYPCTWNVTICVDGLETPGELYRTTIYAQTGNLTSTGWTASFATAPLAPQNVSCVNATNSTITVEITPPGTGKHDNISLSCHSQVNEYEKYDNFSAVDQFFVVNNLTAGVLYTFEARALSHSVYGAPTSENCSTVPNPPGSLNSEVSLNSITLSWTRPSGHFQNYEIYYSNGSTHAIIEDIPESTTRTLNNLSSDSNYTFKLRTMSFNMSSANTTSSNWTLPDIVRDGKAKPDGTQVEICWKPPVRHDNVGLYELRLFHNSSQSCEKAVNIKCTEKNKYILPDNTCKPTNESKNCSTDPICHTIKNLNYATSYVAKIVAVNPGGRSVPAEYVFTIMAEPNYAWIAGVVIGVLVGILLVLLLLMLIQRWRQGKSPFRTKTRTPDSYSDGRENPTYEEVPEPVAIYDFVSHVNRLNQDSNYLFACEYLLLGKLSPQNPAVAADLPENRAKNRYTDILPFDDSRVKLIPQADVDEEDPSDYINASYLPGFNSKHEYIAAQGPMGSTVDSFWCMIWQQKVSMIVMVTNLSERGREKCEQYWPENDATVCYGNVTVQVKSESPMDFYTIRVMEFSVDDEKRQLSQYHFLTWPDFGVPEDIEHILTFVTEIRKNFEGQGPMLVHCSAGVGRTGTFVVVDHLLQLIKREQFIDLFHLVLELRQHRPKMIQAESQYIFAHECIKVAIEKGLHRQGASMYIAENEQENGECLYVNSSETVVDPPLYANSSEFHEQPV